LVAAFGNGIGNGNVHGRNLEVLMKKFTLFAAGILLGFNVSIAHSREAPGISRIYRALHCDPATATALGTWGILDRDGANRKVDPYLSSLAGGEVGTGTISSPPFTLSTDAIKFTICGHDGQGGGRGKNLLALVNSKTGEVLRKTMAPGSDPLQARSWDVKGLRGSKVRIEVRDGIAEGAFAWLGVGEIDAGPELRIDFRRGLPGGWKVAEKPEEKERGFEILRGGVPFRALRQTLVPAGGAAEIPCGIRARRLFVLGCTVYRGKPLDVCGHIEIQYRSGPPDRIPLMVGYTLEGEFKLLSRSRAMHLHPSGDPFQYYLVLAPREEVIEKIKIQRNPGSSWIPKITAITCETTENSGNLRPLPDTRPGDDERAWIQSHTVSGGTPDMKMIEAEIRRWYRM